MKRPIKWILVIGFFVFACAWMGSPLVNYGKFPKISLPAETVFTIGPLAVTNTSDRDRHRRYRVADCLRCGPRAKSARARPTPRFRAACRTSSS